MVSKATTTLMPVSSKISSDALLKTIPSMYAFMRWALVVAQSCRTFFILATQSIVGAVFSMSGAWFNNQPTVGGVATGPLSVTIQWDELNSTHGRRTGLMTYGGLNDNYGDPMLANFGVPNGQITSPTWRQHARPWLQEQNRTVIACSHDRGHQNHPALSMSLVGEFFKAHQASSI